MLMASILTESDFTRLRRKAYGDTTVFTLIQYCFSPLLAFCQHGLAALMDNSSAGGQQRNTRGGSQKAFPNFVYLLNLLQLIRLTVALTACLKILFTFSPSYTSISVPNAIALSGLSLVPLEQPTLLTNTISEPSLHNAILSSVFFPQFSSSSFFPSASLSKQEDFPSTAFAPLCAPTAESCAGLTLAVCITLSLLEVMDM